MSAVECARHFSMAVVQQLGFQVSNAQRPRLRHQLSSLTEAVVGTLTASVKMNGGNSLFATCFLEILFFRAPLGMRARLARLLRLAAFVHGVEATCIDNVGLQAASGILKGIEMTTRKMR